MWVWENKSRMFRAMVQLVERSAILNSARVAEEWKNEAGGGHVVKSTSSFPDQTQTSLSFSLRRYYCALSYFVLFYELKRLEQARINMDSWQIYDFFHRCCQNVHGKNKRVVHEALPSVIDDHSVTSSGISSWTDTRQRGIWLFHIRWRSKLL